MALHTRHLLKAALLPALLLSVVAPAGGQSSTKIRVYSHLLNPREHPDDDRRHVRPPTWDTFDNRTRFTTLRHFEIKDGELVNYREEIDKYTRGFELGDVIWPSYPTLFAKNLADLADEIQKRKLYLFDIWGYVPGSGPGGYWQQFCPPAGVFDLLESKLGDRWLGMDVGEQDGRYIGGYAPQMYPASASRFRQYVNFQRHFERLCNELGNRMATLVSLNFGHYFLKEGVYTLIGAETAQALPNGQVYYAFIRGAGKQYGVPWFGNASVWNRWGHKTYSSEGPEHGPTKGTSLSLMKRLLYSHILYNCVLVGFESGWLEGDRLSPIGRVQQAARRWVRQHGQLGVMLTPIALMVDFFSGWSFPRHLYTRNVYRVWGNLPYEGGDYLTDGVLDMLYPGYQDSSYFHDESGFLTPTPYGDSADVLLSDAPAWLLARYPVLVVAGELSGGAEIRDKLRDYAEAGGHLVITAGNLSKLPGGLGGIRTVGPPRSFKPTQTVQAGSVELTEQHAFEALGLELPRGANVLARVAGSPLAAEVPVGQGRITVLASLFGVPLENCTGPISNEVDKPLAKPYPLLRHVRVLLDRVFRSQVLFEAGEGLSLVACRRSPGEYTLGVANNSWREQPFKIVSYCGQVESMRELPLDESEKNAVGYLPEGIETATLGVSGERTIAGGDIRIFVVRVREENVEEVRHIVPPPHPRRRALPLRDIHSIKEEILKRPTFFQHFDGVVVDWRYLRRRDKDALLEEAGWLKRQGLNLFVDLTSGLNLYPDLRLVDNIEADYAASLGVIEDVMAKMRILGARHLILSLHRFPENNFTREQTWAGFEKTLRRICEQAEKDGIQAHLRVSQGKPPADVREAVEFLRRVGASNLRLAPNTAQLLSGKADIKAVAGSLEGIVGLWLASAPQRDIGGSVWNTHAPIAGNDEDRLAKLLAIAPDVPVLLDAVYGNLDQEYLDARALDRLLSRSAP